MHLSTVLVFFVGMVVCYCIGIVTQNTLLTYHLVGFFLLQSLKIRVFGQLYSSPHDSEDLKGLKQATYNRSKARCT